MTKTRDWFVSCGGATLGPLTIDDIATEIQRGRLGGDAWVWRPMWAEARPLTEVRELASHTLPNEERSALEAWCAWLDDAKDTGELLAMTLQGLVLATNASVGVAHAPHRSGSFVATCAVGGRGAEILGHATPTNDPALARARLGSIVVPRASSSRVGHASLGRLGELDGQSVALTPVFAGGKLLAVFELGRGDHPFRSGDDKYLRGTARTASDRAGRMRVQAQPRPS